MKQFLIRGIPGLLMLAVIRAARAAIPPLNNEFIRYLGVSEEIAPGISGTVLALGYIIAVVGPILGGHFSDTKGHTKTFLTGGFVFAVFFMLWTFAPFYQILYFYMVVLALASASVYIGLQAFFLEGAPEGKKGMGMGFYGVGFGVGAALGPMIGSILAPQVGVVQAYYVLAITSLVVTILVLIVVQIIKKIQQVDTYAKKQEEKTREPFWKIMTTQRLPVYILIIAGVLVGTNNAAVFANIDDLGVSLGWEVGRGTMGVAVFALVSFLQPYGGHLGDKFGKARSLIIGTLMLTIGFGGLAFIENPVLIYPLAAVAGIGGMFWTPNSMALMGSYAEPHLKGTLLGYLQSATGLGSALGAVLGGYIHSVINVHATFTMVFIAGVLAVIAALILLLKSPPEASKEEQSA